MKTDLFPCPNIECYGHHALCWMNRKNGRDLGVMCNSGLAPKPKFYTLPKNKIDQMDLTELVDLPEYWTPDAKKKIEAAGNLQLVLMNAQPGESVERTMPPDRARDDAERARTLQTHLAQLGQAQDELTRQIESLALKRIKLENDERETRKKLREYATEPLKLERYD